ncbi:MAG TPA: hypothetical protein VFM18_21340 [Methanosarcina sp.]|nr:hypothetical protein [Methanosarcina sp.]
MPKLTFDEFKSLYVKTNITEDQKEEFYDIHGIHIDDEIEQVAWIQYQDYLKENE